MLRIGIPRALSYYRYFPFWKVLLEGIGAEVVVSTIQSPSRGSGIVLTTYACR